MEILKKYNINGIYNPILALKLCVGDLEKAVAYDTLGESAIASIEKQISANEMTDTLGAIWQKIKSETNGGVE